MSVSRFFLLVFAITWKGGLSHKEKILNLKLPAILNLCNEWYFIVCYVLFKICYVLRYLSIILLVIHFSVSGQLLCKVASNNKLYIFAYTKLGIRTCCSTVILYVNAKLAQSCIIISSMVNKVLKLLFMH